VILFALLLGSGFVSPAMAKVLNKVPFVGVIYDDYKDDYGLQRGKTLDITQKYEKTIISNNIIFSIKDVYYDGTNLTIAYNVKNLGKQWTDSTEKNRYFLFDSELKINGEKLTNFGISSTPKEITPDEFEGILGIKAENFEDNFTLNLSFSNIKGVKGEWNFDIPVTIDKVKESVVTFTPNFKTTGLGREINIKSVVFSPSAIELKTEMIVDKGTDGDILFTIEEVGVDNGFKGDIKILENGKELITHWLIFPPLSPIPQEITIRAYNMSNNKENVIFKVPLK
jgi:hypothetical protein